MAQARGVSRRGQARRGPGSVSRRILDPEDGQLRCVRARDTVLALYVKGALSDDRRQAVAMKAAGDTFAANFYMASLVGYRASNLEPRSRGCGEPTEEMAAAARWVSWAIRTVGGDNSLAASVLWHVVGMGDSLNEWAGKAPVAAGSPAMRHQTATYILIGALHALVANGKKDVDKLA